MKYKLLTLAILTFVFVEALYAQSIGYCKKRSVSAAITAGETYNFYGTPLSEAGRYSHLVKKYQL